MNIACDTVAPGIRMIAETYGAELRDASARDLPLFLVGIDPSDKIELNATWRQNWEQELYASLIHSDHAYLAQLPGHEGHVLFGAYADRELAQAAQVWMLRTRSFTASMRAHGTTSDCLRLQSAVVGVLRLFVRQYGTVFNFFPASQTRTIRWLRLCGMNAIGRSDRDTGFVVCGAGAGFAKLAANPLVWNDYLGDLAQ